VEIEALTVEDWERLRAIRLAALREAPQAFGSSYETVRGWAASQWRERLHDIPTFLAVEGGRDIGIVCGWLCKDRADAAYVISMWVDPGHRRVGVASALLDHVRVWAAGLGRARLLLDVRADNEAAIAMYRDYGFRSTGVEHLDDGHLELQMALPL
jgi:ribosomal protein S18 acetylase RimI-like enzyme